MKILSLSAIGLHLGYLGCYGNEWIATPNIDRLATESVVFDQHYAESPKTDALGISPGEWLAASVRGLDELTASDGLVEVPKISLVPPWKLSGDMAVVYAEDDEVQPWLDPPAGPCADEELILRAQDTYAALITWFDAQLGTLLDRIAAESAGDQLMLLLTSASGYPLGEHGQIGWSMPNVYEEAIHVPLLARFPGRQFAGTRVATLTADADLRVAIEAWTSGAAAPSALDALVRGEIAAIRPHVKSVVEIGGISARSLRTLDWALVRTGEKRELYRKPEDRWEVNDVAEHEVDAADELEAALNSV